MPMKRPMSRSQYVETAYNAALELIAAGEPKLNTRRTLLSNWLGLKAAEADQILVDVRKDALSQGIEREDIDPSWFKHIDRDGNKLDMNDSVELVQGAFGYIWMPKGTITELREDGQVLVAWPAVPDEDIEAGSWFIDPYDLRKA